MKSNTIIIGLGAAGAFLYSLFNEEVLAIERNEEAGRKLSPSGQSILQTCSKLRKLGARQSDRNPLPQLQDETGDI